MTQDAPGRVTAIAGAERFWVAEAAGGAIVGFAAAGPAEDAARGTDWTPDGTALEREHQGRRLRELWLVRPPAGDNVVTREAALAARVFEGGAHERTRLFDALAEPKAQAP